MNSYRFSVNYNDLTLEDLNQRMYDICENHIHSDRYDITITARKSITNKSFFDNFVMENNNETYYFSEDIETSNKKSKSRVSANELHKKNKKFVRKYGFHDKMMEWQNAKKRARELVRKNQNYPSENN